MAAARLTPSDCGSLLAGAERSAEEAAASAGGFEEHLHGVGGFAVRLRFAGKPLIMSLAPTMAHVATQSVSGPPLTIRIWDSESTGAPEPAELEGDGVVRGHFGERGRSFFEAGHGSLSVLHSERDEGFYWARHSSQGPAVECITPLSPILGSWLAEKGVQLVHAAAVGTPDGCVLLVGGPRAGKSTAVLSCLAAGLRCVGDDTCLIGSGDVPTVSSVYRSVNGDAAVIDRLPFIEREIRAGEMPGKALGFLADRASLQEAPLRAVVVVRIAGTGRSRLLPASPVDALAAIGPTSILQMREGGQPAFTRLAEVLRGTPCHRLEMGTSPEPVAAAVASLL